MTDHNLQHETAFRLITRGGNDKIFLLITNFIAKTIASTAIDTAIIEEFMGSLLERAFRAGRIDHMMHKIHLRDGSQPVMDLLGKCCERTSGMQPVDISTWKVTIDFYHMAASTEAMLKTEKIGFAEPDSVSIFDAPIVIPITSITKYMSKGAAEVALRYIELNRTF